MRRVVARRLLWAGLAVSVLVALAAAALNVYLNSRYLPRLIRAEQQWLQVDYRWAWTIWPGRVHFEGVRLRGHERGFAWVLEADRAVLDAEVVALADRRLVIEDLEVERAAFRLRPRLHYLDALPDRTAGLAEVPSEAPQLSVEGPEPAPEARAATDPWAISVRRARMSRMKELWVDRVRIGGPIDAEGALVVEPGRRVRIGPTRWKIRGGALAAAGAPILERLTGAGSASLGPVDLGAEVGAGPLATLSADGEVKAEVVGMGFLPKLRGLPVALELREGKGPLTSTLKLESGRLAPGTSVAFGGKGIRARIAGFDATGDLEIAASIGAEAPARVALTSTLSGWALGKEGAPPLSSGRTARLALELPAIDLSRWRQIPDALAAGFRERPARALLEEVRLVHEERALQLESRADRLEAAVDLGALERKELVLSEVRAQGAEVRVRPRLKKPDATAAYLETLPPIAGFADPPLLGDAPAPGEGWSLRASDAVVEDVREVWLEAYRFRGRSTARGGFEYGRDGRFSTGPVRVQVHSGELSIARWKAASRLSGAIELAVAPVDARAEASFGYFRTLGLRAEVKGEVADVAFLRHYPSLPFPAVLRGGQGPLSARIALSDAVVQPGSEVVWESGSIEAVTHGHRIVGPVKVEARWSEAGGETRMRLDARVAPYRVTRVGEERALLRGSAVVLRMDSPTFDLAHPAFEPFTTARTVDGAVPDLRAVNAYLPKDLPLKVDEGSGTFAGRLAWSQRGAITAALEIGGKKAALAWERLKIRGDWKCEAKLANVDVATGAADIALARVELDDMAVHEGPDRSERWFGMFEMKGGKLRPGAVTLLEGDVETTMRDGRPLVAFFASETDLLPRWAQSLITLQALRATARLRVGARSIELDKLYARGQSLELRGRVRKDAVSQRGDLLVTARGQEVGVSVRGERVELKLIGAAAWYRGQMGEKWGQATFSDPDERDQRPKK